MNLAITSLNNQSINPEFKAKKPKVKYSDIRHIVNVPCACCGKKVLVPAFLEKIYASVARPLKTILNDGNAVLGFCKDREPIWKELQKLAQENPKESFDKLMQKKENRIPLSNAIETVAKEDYTKEQGKDLHYSQLCIYKDILYKLRTKLRISSVVMKKFAPLKTYLDGTKLQTFEQLEIYSRKYPRKTLSEIINIPEIYEFHRTKDLLQRAETKEQINFRFENIKLIVKKVNPEAAEKIDALQDEAMGIFTKYSDEKTRMIKIKQLYAEVLKNNNCEKVVKKVHNEIDKMPVTYITMDSFLTYAHNHEYNDTNIISAIFGPVTSSFEHVVPRSCEGADKMDNGLVMHQSCNKSRGNISYEEFFEYHPEMPHNIQKQVNYIAKKILNGDFDESFKFWPMNISRTLYKYTNGIVKLDMTKYCEKGLEQIEERIDARNVLIDKLNKDRTSKINQRLELQKQIADLDSELNDIHAKSKNLTDQNGNEKPLISSYKAHIQIQKRHNKKS